MRARFLISAWGWALGCLQLMAAWLVQRVQLVAAMLVQPAAVERVSIAR
jgi:hypothetical protein